MNILIKMEWNEPSQKWLMKLPSGAFLYDLWDCENIRKLFDEQLDKHKEKWFEINIKERNENGTDRHNIHNTSTEGDSIW